MPKFVDLTGHKQGDLTVLYRADNGPSGSTRWVCKCVCGKTKIVLSQHLKNGHVTSCGCGTIKKRLNSGNIVKHGLHNHRVYSIWSGMKRRCFNPNFHQFQNYGGKGIKVCEEWLKPEPFIEWAFSNGYKDNLTLDRIDPNGNYEPSNCRWANRSVQGVNKSLHKDNKTGYPGVYKRGENKFHARIKFEGKQKHLGTFKTLEEAVEARKKAEKEWFNF